MSIYKLVAFILIFIIIISSVGGVLFLNFGNPAAEITSNLEFKQKLEFETLELAITNKEKEIGYMNRETICAKCGMLFVFDSQQPLSFWMKNTLVPLRISFIDQDGKVINTGVGQPKVTSPTVNSTSPAKYVLEVPIDSQVITKDGEILDIQGLIATGVGHTTTKVVVN
jgi:uncharacterized membrane protein (UPF0127 family)